MQRKAANADELQLLSVAEAQGLLGISRTMLWQEVLSGRLASVRIGRRRLIRPADLGAYIDARVEGGPAQPPALAAPRRGQRR
ncbi:MAG: helix-turn-helix domain-containing protein [Candidatus Dormibacteraeota bacterium]|jgi:excisionase family DNA binding protein|nr:helix-turn-helix domain-containing protein [Candidatus Dormibacteraeota bacterium]